MKKIGECALSFPTDVVSRNESLSFGDFHQTREALRQQCEADLDS